jgi:hypothetical protein
MSAFSHPDIASSSCSLALASAARTVRLYRVPAKARLKDEDGEFVGAHAFGAGEGPPSPSSSFKRNVHHRPAASPTLGGNPRP